LWKIVILGDAAVFHVGVTEQERSQHEKMYLLNAPDLARIPDAAVTSVNTGQLADTFRSNVALADALTWTAARQYLVADMGFLAVLHTWSKNMRL
jgi:hypothetical protein